MLIEKLEYLRVSLNDNDLVEDFTFGGNSVSATLGTKDGAICAPILDLNIINESSIFITGQGFEFTWEDIEIGENQISVICNGKPCVYSIKERIKPKQQNRRLP